MIRGIGIDTVDISRFTHWYTKSDAALSRIFSSKEITYCKQNSSLSAQRFAVRFAAREACFKAWCTAYPDTYIPFLTMCRMITITHNKHKAPHIALIGHKLALSQTRDKNPIIHLSLSHTKALATAFIIISG